MKMVTITRNNEGLETPPSPWILISGFKLLNTKVVNTKSNGIKQSGQSITDGRKHTFLNWTGHRVFWFNVGKDPPCLVPTLPPELDLLELVLSSILCGPTFPPAAPSLPVQLWSLRVRITFLSGSREIQQIALFFKLWCTICQASLHTFPSHCLQALTFYLYSYPNSLYGWGTQHAEEPLVKTKSTSLMFGMK